MEIYIATKPVRFDKDYAIGESIPEGVIEPKMVKRLTDWGKVRRMTVPDPPPEDAGFTCSVCGKVCASKSALTAHSKTH